jgi:CHAT domain-containing protein/tetratricopeptide (TPR) repeat protein
MNAQPKAKADQLIQQGIEEYETGKSGAAIESLQEALNIYQQIKHRQGEAEALENIGLIYNDMRNYVKAIEFYQQYLGLVRELEDEEGEHTALDSLGNVYYSLGNNIKAIECHQQSWLIAQKLEDVQEEGRSLNKLGLAYAAMGSYREAIQHYQQSLVIAREIEDRQNEAWVLENLGSAYSDFNNYGKAIEYYQQSLAIMQELQDREDETWVLENLGSAYFSLGDYAKAIESYQQCLIIAQELKASSEPYNFQYQREAWIHCKLGMVYQSLGDVTKASEFYQQSLGLAQLLHKRELEGQILGKLGSVCLNAGLYDKAIEYQQQFLAIVRELPNRQLLAHALAKLGEAYYFKGDYATAIEFSQQSLKIARQIPEHPVERQAWENLGNVYNELGDCEKAIDSYQQSLTIARKLQDHHLEAGTLNNLGCAFFRSGNFEQAEKTLREAIKIWDSIRVELGTYDTYKVSIFDVQAKTYRHLQQALIARGETDAALEVAEQGRTRALVELLTTRFSTQPPSDYTTLENIKSIAKQQNATLVEYSVIYHSLQGQGKPKYRNTDLLIWVIQPTGCVTFRSVDITFLKQQNTPLGQFVDFARESIGVRGRDAFAVTSDEVSSINNQQLRQLHEFLIEPIADLLPTDTNSHVIFIPTGPLFLVPFPALWDASGRYLIEKHTILTVPSIQVLAITQNLSASLREKKQKQDPNLAEVKALVVGNPTMPKIALESGLSRQFDSPQTIKTAKSVCTTCSGGSYDKSLLLQDCLKSLRPLPGAEREAKDIASLLNTQPIIGDKATKVAILQQMPSSGIIHLATHGLLDDFERLGIPGAIVLASEEEDNGLLTAGEIKELKLNAELVVLSACDTGRGRLAGDGVIGLSRSLISAGVPSIIVSLWAVPDAPTAELMTEFYKNFYKRKLNKAQALRSAMLTIMQQHPNNSRAWAAFTLIGQP